MALSPRIKRPRREAANSPACSAALNVSVTVSVCRVHLVRSWLTDRQHRPWAASDRSAVQQIPQRSIIVDQRDPSLTCNMRYKQLYCVPNLLVSKKITLPHCVRSVPRAAVRIFIRLVKNLPFLRNLKTSLSHYSYCLFNIHFNIIVPSTH
jgi:hypothetical protein